MVVGAVISVVVASSLAGPSSLAATGESENEESDMGRLQGTSKVTCNRARRWSGRELGAAFLVIESDKV